MSDETLEQAVAAAQGGDRDALERVVAAVQDRLYQLAVRFLADPHEARDATQEILVLLVTRLSAFEGRSAFTTWAYRLAVNALIDMRRRNARFAELTFEAFALDLETGLADDSNPHADDVVMTNELRMACTSAMLLCLDLDQRVAYVLGDILQLDHTEASAVVGVSPAAFRKRLSRARKAVVAFTASHCGLANSSARCRCPRRLPAALAAGRLRPGETPFTDLGDAPEYDDVREQARAVGAELQALLLQRALPEMRCPDAIGRAVVSIVDRP